MPPKGDLSSYTNNRDLPRQTRKELHEGTLYANSCVRQSHREMLSTHRFNRTNTIINMWAPYFEVVSLRDSLSQV